MELQWPEFLITCTFQLHAMLLPGKFYFIALGPFLRIRSQICCSVEGFKLIAINSNLRY